MRQGNKEEQKVIRTKS